MFDINKIRDVRFNKANIGGYRTDEVDEFISSVEDMVVAFNSREQELTSEIKKLENRVAGYERDENYIKEAIVSAKKISDMEIKEAKQKADCIIKEASEKTNDLMVERDLELKTKEEMLNKMKKEVADFKSRLLNEYKVHLKMISSIEKGYSNQENVQEGTDNSKKNIVISESNTEEIKKVAGGEKTDLDRAKNNVENKFEKLGGIKFGANYDIKKDDDSPINLFK